MTLASNVKNRGYHATSMFYAHPELVDTVGDWFVKYLVDQSQATATPN